MRDLNLSISAFDDELALEFSQTAETFTFLASGNKADKPETIPVKNVDFKNMEIFFNYSDPELLRGLAIRSWYFSDESQGWELRRLIKTRLRKSTIDFEQRLKILPLLESKEMMLNFLVECDDSISASVWYSDEGLKKISRQLRRVKVRVNNEYRRERKIPKYTGYCRGYQSSRQQERKVSSQALANDTELERWRELKYSRERLDQLNELATQLWILRDFKSYNNLKEDLESLSGRYKALKDYFGLTEESIDNLIHAEQLHREEGVPMFKFN